MDYIEKAMTAPCSGQEPDRTEFQIVVANRNPSDAAWIACTAHPEESGGAWLKAVEAVDKVKPSLEERLGSFCTGCALNCLQTKNGSLDNTGM